MKGRLLLVEDDLEMCKMVAADFRRRGVEVRWHTLANEAFQSLICEDFDVLLADINLPGMNGIELCERIADERPDIPVIIMTAFGSMEKTIQSIRAGAYDFITKPVDLDILAIAVERAITHRELQEKVKTLAMAAEQSQQFDHIVGESPVMQDLFSRLNRIADTDTSVLITGESGSGKELAARSLHQRSRRHQASFVPINCAALPESLLESELFGHRRGAFTDAKEDRKGLFMQAHHGTLFLDEIGDLPMPLQPKLLRAIEDRHIRPVGANRETSIDVRIIAATNQDLEAAIENNMFREDLFYRLNVVQLDIPPLRERGTDILMLCQHFVKKFSGRFEKQVSGISQQAAKKLLLYNWPGNVRELHNAIEHAVAMTLHDKVVVEDLPIKIQDHQSRRLIVGTQNPDELISMEELERRYILHVIKTTGGNRSMAARILGMDRKTLYRKLQQYGLDSFK